MRRERGAEVGSELDARLEQLDHASRLDERRVGEAHHLARTQVGFDRLRWRVATARRGIETDP
jgi:hypothetical protein